MSKQIKIICVYCEEDVNQCLCNDIDWRERAYSLRKALKEALHIYNYACGDFTTKAIIRLEEALEIK